MSSQAVLEQDVKEEFLSPPRSDRWHAAHAELLAGVHEDRWVPLISGRQAFPRLRNFGRIVIHGSGERFEVLDEEQAVVDGTPRAAEVDLDVGDAARDLLSGTQRPHHRPG